MDTTTFICPNCEHKNEIISNPPLVFGCGACGKKLRPIFRFVEGKVELRPIFYEGENNVG